MPAGATRSPCSTGEAQQGSEAAEQLASSLQAQGQGTSLQDFFLARGDIAVYFYQKGTSEDQIILENLFQINCESNSWCHGIREEAVAKDTKLFS